MATKRCGFPPLLLLALPLLFLAATSSGHNLDQCQVPRLDQEFCNSFYSVCLSSPNKLCLAQSMSQCLGSTGFPSGILYSISNYLIEFIHTIMITINPPGFGGSGPSPPSPPALPAPPMPLLPPTLPPRASPPSPPPPPPPPPPSSQPPPSLIAWPRPLPPVQPQPQQPPMPHPRPPHRPLPPLPPTLPPKLPSPPQRPPPSQPPQPWPQPQPPQWVLWQLPLVQPPNVSLPPPPTTPPRPPPAQPQPPPRRPTRPPTAPLPDWYWSLPSVQPLPQQPPIPQPQPPMLSIPPYWPLQPSPSVITGYQTGNEYMDYIISLLLSLPEKQIENIIEIMIPDISMGGTSQGQVRSQDIDILLLKLKFLLHRYSFQKFDENYLETCFQYLLTSNASLLNWFSMVLDQIFMDLKIQLPVDGTDHYPSFPLEGVFSTNTAYRQSLETCHATPASGAVCERYCTDNYGGNWIAIQYREKDLERPGAFDKSLDDYIRGFGDYQTGYWMGLACLSDITSRYKMELLVELADGSGVTALAHYGHFRVGTQSAGYPLQLGTFMGGALGDGLRSAEGCPFTTRDRDMDQFRNNCAVKHKGGWWYENCQQTSPKNYLNGYFSTDPSKYGIGIKFPHFGVRWETFDTTYVLVSTRMFMRRASPIAMPYGLETFGGAMGAGGETYGVTYSGGSGASVNGAGGTYELAYNGGGGAIDVGGGETYEVAYSGGGGASIGGETYDYDTSDYALMMFDGGGSTDGGSYGVTYGSSAGGNTAGGSGVFEMLDN